MYKMGNFPRRLDFYLLKCREIVMVCDKLHNFMVDYREEFDEYL